jgi:hypothetical protein
VPVNGVMVGLPAGTFGNSMRDPSTIAQPHCACLQTLGVQNVYPLGSLVGAVAAVLVAAIFRGASTAQEAQAAMGTPLEQKEAIIPTST